MFLRTKLLQRCLAHNVRFLGCRSMHLLRDNAYVNGKWVGANNKQTFPICNPVDNSVIACVPDMNIADTQLAIDAATKAFKSFSKTTAKERSDLLRKWYNLMVEHSEDLACILTKENGKSLAESRAEIKYGNSFVEWFAEEARRIDGEILQAPVANRELFLLKQPVGVAALITPWNFPHAMITRKAAAALAAGCTCVVKPSEDTPLTALALAELAEQAGFPAGIFNVLTTSITNSPAVGKELCENPKVRVLSFTGSTAVGKILYGQCASTMKRLGLELGGNAPYIVFKSADVDLAVNSAMASKFRNTGQTCVSANRFFVEADIFDEFVKKFVERIKKDIKMGDGSKENVTHGPLIKQSQLDMVSGLVNEAVQKGAKIRCGGAPLPNLGALFYAPTVLTDVTKDSQIYNKEIFGPVAVINKFSNEEDVLKQANDTPVGLAGYFFSQDISQIFRVARKLEVGMVGVNEGVISSTEAAFGGVKESGLGREGSKHGVDDFLDIKYVCIGNLKR
ncbi:succinate-semialdehyde dehydrogenase [NADP(+)] GabD isoform X1 [Odontomachus brunneus]|uniref:succinate-semialdehyde dehydrogenase [NADP(+)] GabD isoform X1 n=2 Tax=Odontomachus brunneus TaxID=486640 RepID=UPI0013F1A139|nr:succinate-semialdehyde dehydrogenase [NADP(+)] GabD isoform X1 [Odontomachus brunneus]XP_032690377.1 succinate-semialdehyde dehydrogenase [NADP(+)] GabD isoform X1 [Odontomachus brunneus]